MKAASPLRYPGGKWRIAPFFQRLLALNDLEGCTYVEPYAGGASLALSLLIAKDVSEIHLNDLDASVHAVWYSMIRRTSEFIERIRTVPLTVTEWRRQKAVYAAGASTDQFGFGFATFFLNRTNHSGILNGGPIGGQRQNGEWLIDARFNRQDLIARVARIGMLRNQIHLYHDDAARFLGTHRFGSNALIYLDPPYYVSGKDLYLSGYNRAAHVGINNLVRRLRSKWVVSYDDVSEIRRIYSGIRSRRLQLFHSARESRIGNEVMFFSDGLRVPRL